MTVTSLIICGENFTPGPRIECPNSVHDHPLPAGYSEAHDAAGQRTRAGWKSKRCPDCKLYGWVKPRGESRLH